jgi:hypothetical protein
MAKTKANSSLPYVQRLLEDEYLHERLREAAVGLRGVYGRAATKKANAADDKKLYASLRHAATSIRDAALELRKPEPPPKRRLRKLLIIGLAAGGAAMLTRLGRERPQPAGGSEVRAETASPVGDVVTQPEPVATSATTG